MTVTVGGTTGEEGSFFIVSRGAAYHIVKVKPSSECGLRVLTAEHALSAAAAGEYERHMAAEGDVHAV